MNSRICWRVRLRLLVPRLHAVRVSVQVHGVAAQHAVAGRGAGDCVNSIQATEGIGENNWGRRNSWLRTADGAAAACAVAVRGDRGGRDRCRVDGVRRRCRVGRQRAQGRSVDGIRGPGRRPRGPFVGDPGRHANEQRSRSGQGLAESGPGGEGDTSTGRYGGNRRLGLPGVMGWEVPLTHIQCR